MVVSSGGSIGYRNSISVGAVGVGWMDTAESDDANMEADVEADVEAAVLYGDDIVKIENILLRPCSSIDSTEEADRDIEAGIEAGIEADMEASVEHAVLYCDDIDEIDDILLEP